VDAQQYDSADTTAKEVAMSTAPLEWRNGKIVLSKPARPIKGRGHVRVRFFLDRPKADAPARQWYFRTLYESCAYPNPNADGSPKGAFVSPEAMALWNKHKTFWKGLVAKQLEGQLRDKHVQSEREKTRRSAAQSSLKHAATESSLAVLDVRRKIERFSDMVASPDTFPLAAELVRAADAFLIHALLGGAELTATRRGRSDRTVTWHPGKVLHRHLKVSSKTDRWEERAAESPAWLLFWLAIARGKALSGLPKSIDISALDRIQFAIPDAASAEALVDILKVLNHFEKLRLKVGGAPFSTAGLPGLPSLKLLAFGPIVEHDGCVYEVTLAGLGRMKKLKVVEAGEAIRLYVTPGEESAYESIRIEPPANCWWNSLAACTDDPPAMLTDLACLDEATARVAVRMVSDHSKSRKQPQWWKPAWRTSRRWSHYWEPTWDHRPKFHSGRIHLPRCIDMSPEAASVLAGSGLPLLVTSKCLTPDVVHALVTTESEIAITEIATDRNLCMDIAALHASTLYVDLAGPLSRTLANRLAAFRGAKLIVACADLSKDGAVELLAYRGELILATSEARPAEGVAVSPAVAGVLTDARATIRFAGAEDLPCGQWLMPGEVCEALASNRHLDLGDYRRREYRKSVRGGEDSVTIQLRYAPKPKSLYLGGDLECVIATTRGARKTTVVKQIGKMHFPGIWLPRFAKACEEVLSRGYRLIEE
jgi:hypothetical protein